MDTKTEKTLLITGVSSGIGYGLATWYLDQGWQVYAISRRRPRDLTDRENCCFASVDLRDLESTPHQLSELLGAQRTLDLVILNAGVLGVFGDIGDATLHDMKQTMDVNVWANKVVLDALFENDAQVTQVVTISSGASVNGNRGWNGYSISKAALNMLTLLYARERPDTHFCAFAPGLVDTEIQDALGAIPLDERYPSLASINAKRNTLEMPSPDAAAPLLAAAIARLPRLVESGAYADIRQLPDA